jgi:hypothetical protein
LPVISDPGADIPRLASLIVQKPSGGTAVPTHL